MSSTMAFLSSTGIEEGRTINMWKVSSSEVWAGQMTSMFVSWSSTILAGGEER